MAANPAYDPALDAPAEKPPLGARLMRLVRKQPLGTAGALVVVIMILAAIFAPWIAPYDPTANNFEFMHEAPSATFWLGTDQFGRDLLSRIIYGARTALFVGFVSAFVGAIDRAGARRRQRLLRRPLRPLLPARHGRVHGLPADHHGAGRGRDLRHRRPERDHRDHHPVHPALRARGALERAGDARYPLHRRGASHAASATRASSCATWCRT